MLQGLETLRELTDLNLSGNMIESVGNSLGSLTCLEVLRLSGNKLTSLQVLARLYAVWELNINQQITLFAWHYSLLLLVWIKNRELRHCAFCFCRSW